MWVPVGFSFGNRIPFWETPLMAPVQEPAGEPHRNSIFQVFDSTPGSRKMRNHFPVISVLLILSQLPYRAKYVLYPKTHVLCKLVLPPVDSQEGHLATSRGGGFATTNGGLCKTERGPHGRNLTSDTGIMMLTL